MALQLCHRSTRVSQGRLRLDSPASLRKSTRIFATEKRSFSSLHRQFTHQHSGNKTSLYANRGRRSFASSEGEPEGSNEPTEAEAEASTETPLPSTPLTFEEYVDNPERYADLPILTEEEKKRVRHRVGKDGKIILPPWRMVLQHQRRRKIVVIAGAEGALGTSLRSELMNRGHDVIGISRRSPQEWPYHGIDKMQWWEVMGRRGIPDCDALVQLTGSPYLDLHTVPTDKYEQEQYESRGSLTEILAQQLERTKWKPTVFLQASNACIYPASHTAEYDESYAGPWSSDMVGTVNSQYEERSKLFSDQGIRTVQMRLGQVIADHGFMLDHHRIDKKGRAFWSRIGDGSQWMPWIHIVDAVRMMVHAIEREEVQGPLNAVAPEAIRQEQFADELKRQLPFPSLTIPMPATVAHWRLPKRSHLILEGRKVIPKAAQDSHFEFQYPTIASALASVQEDLVPIQWKNPVNTYFDPNKRHGKPD